MKTYVIERRNSLGRLVFDKPQPEHYFGQRAIFGITENEIAQVVYRACPAVTLSGADIARWASHIHPQFVVREKTWH